MICAATPRDEIDFAITDAKRSLAFVRAAIEYIDAGSDPDDMLVGVLTCAHNHIQQTLESLQGQLKEFAGLYDEYDMLKHGALRGAPGPQLKEWAEAIDEHAEAMREQEEED